MISPAMTKGLKHDDEMEGSGVQKWKRLDGSFVGSSKFPPTLKCMRGLYQGQDFIRVVLQGLVRRTG